VVWSGACLQRSPTWTARPPTSAASWCAALLDSSYQPSLYVFLLLEIHWVCASVCWRQRQLCCSKLSFLPRVRPAMMELRCVSLQGDTMTDRLTGGRRAARQASDIGRQDRSSLVQIADFDVSAGQSLCCAPPSRANRDGHMTIDTF